MPYHPTAKRLEGLVVISEERHLWIKGCFANDESVRLELSFEPGGPTIPGTRVSYLRIWSGRKDWFEFQLGKICVRPTEDHWEVIHPIIERLKAYRPIASDMM